MEQIEQLVPVVQILGVPVPQVGASVFAVQEQVIVQRLPKVRVVEHEARVQVPLMAFPSVDVPTTGLHDPNMIVLELDEVDEEAEKKDDVLEMFNGTVWLPPQTPLQSLHGRALRKRMGSRTANKSSMLTLFLEHAPVPQITVELMKTSCSRLWLPQGHRSCAIRGRCADCATGRSAGVPVLRRKLLR